MKKPYLLLFLMIALALFALACGVRNAIPEKDGAKQKGERASVTEPPSLEPIDYDYYCDDSAYYETMITTESPYYLLRLSDMDELREFTSSSELSDEEFNSFIDKDEYRWGGIESREEVEAVSEKLKGLIFPASGEHRFHVLNVRSPENEFAYYLDYEVGDMGNCTFSGCLNPDISADKALERLLADGKFTKVEGSNEKINWLYRRDRLGFTGQLYYEADIDGEYISITTWDLSPEEAEKAILSFDFCRLSDAIAGDAPVLKARHAPSLESYGEWIWFGNQYDLQTAALIVKGTLNGPYCGAQTLEQVLAVRQFSEVDTGENEHIRRLVYFHKSVDSECLSFGADIGGYYVFIMSINLTREEAAREILSLDIWRVPKLAAAIDK